VQEARGLEGLEWALGLDDKAGRRAVARLDALVERRQRGEPIQYVLGHWAFRSLDLLVDGRVLIPRPETELVVDAAMTVLRESGVEHAVVVDLGTGSGAIALSIAAESPLGTVEVWGVDASLDALDVARANLAGLSGRHAAQVRLEAGSWFDALPPELEGRVDLVVTNPPYVAVDEALDREVADWEPRSALIAGPTGLECYDAIMSGAKRWLRAGGSLVGEIGATQGDEIERRARAAGFSVVELLRDLAGHDRIVVAR
jgi:release factor glutamine methyltransferase